MRRDMLRFIASLLCALGGLAAAPTGYAQQAQGPGGYPDRPVRVTVPVAAGGSTDIIARIVLNRFGENIGRPFVIDNRAGAGGILGNEIVASARPDGYTLLFTYAA